MNLTAENVGKILKDCLFGEYEEKNNFVKVEGLMHTFIFHPERLENHRQEIYELLNELPDGFKKSVGGGMSFLAACEDKNGNQWGEHMHTEELFCLGIGLGLVSSPLPREMWHVLPGGMPYYTFID
jgi:hypothetical protein